MIQPASSTMPAYYGTQTSNSKNASIASEPPQPPQKDRVEISHEYYEQRDLRDPNRPKWINATEEELASGGRYVRNENGDTVFVVAKDAYQELGIQGMKESLERGNIMSRMKEEVLNALEFLPGEKRAIASLIDSAASKAGLSRNEINKLKIETDGKGNIVVGGLKDRDKLKKVQQALNASNGLAGRIENFQFIEETMYKRINSMNITPLQLMEGGPAISGMEWIEWKVSQTDDIDSIEGMYDPIGYAVLDYFKDPIESADFSHKKKGVANPKGDMEKAIYNIKDQITAKFGEYNRSEDAKGKGNRIDWSSAKIRITQSGGIEFEGRFAASDKSNNYAENLIREMLQKAMQPSEDGTESIFTTALNRVTIMHDDEYGSGDEMGISKESVFEFNLSLNGPTDAYVLDRNGNAEELAKDSIKKDVAQEINKANPTEKIDSDSIAIAKDGTISLIGKNTAAASKIIDQVNNAIAAAKVGARIDTSSSINKLAVDILTKLQSFNSYGKNASKKFLNYKHEIDVETEYADKYNKWSDEQNYTYSDYIPTENQPQLTAPQRPSGL